MGEMMAFIMQKQIMQINTEKWTEIYTCNLDLQHYIGKQEVIPSLSVFSNRLCYKCLLL